MGVPGSVVPGMVVDRFFGMQGTHIVRLRSVPRPRRKWPRPTNTCKMTGQGWALHQKASAEQEKRKVRRRPTLVLVPHLAHLAGRQQHATLHRHQQIHDWVACRNLAALAGLCVQEMVQQC